MADDDEEVLPQTTIPKIYFPPIHFNVPTIPPKPTPTGVKCIECAGGVAPPYRPSDSRDLRLLTDYQIDIYVNPEKLWDLLLDIDYNVTLPEVLEIVKDLKINTEKATQLMHWFVEKDLLISAEASIVGHEYTLLSQDLGVSIDSVVTLPEFKEVEKNVNLTVEGVGELMSYDEVAKNLSLGIEPGLIPGIGVVGHLGIGTGITYTSEITSREAEADLRIGTSYGFVPPVFGDVIRSASTPGINGKGIGGDGSVIWHTDPYVAAVYELSTSDFSVVRSTSSPVYMSEGIGGDSSVIWYCSSDTDRVYELSTSDFSVVRSALTVDKNPRGIGGDASTIWNYCSWPDYRDYKLSTSDFSIINAASPPAALSNGIGGSASVVWQCSQNSDKIYELSTSNFSIIRSASSPNIYPDGIGGSPSVIWHCDYYPDLVYELYTG